MDLTSTVREIFIIKLRRKKTKKSSNFCERQTEVLLTFPFTTVKNSNFNDFQLNFKSNKIYSAVLISFI
jgi:hypothetical protein